MNKIKTAIYFMALASAIPAIANAGQQGKYYLRADGAYVKSTLTATDVNVSKPGIIDLKKKAKGKAGSVGMGYYVSNSFRIEGQAYYDNGVNTKNTVITKMKQKTYAALVNGYVDVMHNSVIAPYIMGGIGYGKSKFSLNNTHSLKNQAFNSKSKGNLVWQAGFGAGFRASPEVVVDIGYRVMNTGSKKVICLNSVNKQQKCESKLSELIYGGARVEF